jgi:hypothetical protein
MIGMRLNVEQALRWRRMRELTSIIVCDTIIVRTRTATDVVLPHADRFQPRQGFITLSCKHICRPPGRHPGRNIPT